MSVRPPGNKMDNKLKEKLKKIKAVIFDDDGVFFSGRIFIGPEKRKH